MSISFTDNSVRNELWTFIVHLFMDTCLISTKFSTLKNIYIKRDSNTCSTSP